MRILNRDWGRSSVVEHLTFNQVVAGSIPAALILAPDTTTPIGG